VVVDAVVEVEPVVLDAASDIVLCNLSDSAGVPDGLAVYCWAISWAWHQHSSQAPAQELDCLQVDGAR